MTSRTVDLIIFGGCAGTTGVWSLLIPERLYFFLMFIGLVAYLHRRPKPQPSTSHDDDPKATRRIEALFYAQGLKHGQARAEARLKRQGDGRHLPEAS